MSRLIESLEDRRLLSAASALSDAPAPLAASQAVLSAPRSKVSVPLGLTSTALSIADVETILGQAGSQASAGQAIAVVDREGKVLGIFQRAGGDPAEADAIALLAIQRARTAAFFQSTQNAFTTRTARFIIQNHFPQPVDRTPGGPLYGVEFSSFPGSDILLEAQRTGISGDPGGVPLYKKSSGNGKRIPVGGIGVAGDGRDLAPAKSLEPLLKTLPFFQPYTQDAIVGSFNGAEEGDADEAVALAGARGFMAPRGIRATRVFVDGLRFPFVRTPRAKGNPAQTLAALTSGGGGSLIAFPGAGKAVPDIEAGDPRIFNGTVAGVQGLYRNRDATLATAAQEPTRTPANITLASDDAIPNALTAAEVEQIIDSAVRQALVTRAGIREPNGVTAQVHVVVVDLDGDVLAVFRMNDGTNFSYDVAVQKARTAVFFSDDSHAFSTRAIGFMSQKFFPPGIEHGTGGPLFQLQDKITQNLGNLQDNTLKNGITIFPGGVPLYKNGQLVGAVGVSGDGVDQDDLIAFGGQNRFRPSEAIRSDNLAPQDAADFIISRVQQLLADAGMTDSAGSPPTDETTFDVAEARRKLVAGLKDVRLPFVKFPRNPVESK